MLNTIIAVARWLDDAVAQLRLEGACIAFIAVEADEERLFRERFGETMRVGRLDWPRFAERREPIYVRIYDLLIAKDPVCRRTDRDGANLVVRRWQLYGRPEQSTFWAPKVNRDA